MDPDPLVLAQRLLANAADLDGKGEGNSPQVQIIEIPGSDDYDCLTFSIPEILQGWSNRVKELVVDSACEYSHN